MCDCVKLKEDDEIQIYRCKNTYCRNKICDNCLIICNCCDNTICKLCAKLCEIENCQNYVCIPIAKKTNSDTLKLEYNYEYDENSCWAGCGRNYICIDHRSYLYDEDLIVCMSCTDESEYNCKCGDCDNNIIYKNCEVKCQVKKDCINYIKSNHMLVNSCENCGTIEYACIDCFVTIDECTYCANCAN